MSYQNFRNALLQEYNHCCAGCGCADPDILQIDHCQSRRDGGSDDYENLQILCMVCNGASSKGRSSTPRLMPRKPERNMQRYRKARREFRTFCAQLRRA